jgi:hypothetical protein
MIVVGDPEQCLEKMLKYEALGVDQLICYVQFGHLSHESVMRTIEILGKEVIPELDKRDRERNGKAEAAPARARRADDLEAAKGLID